MESSTGGPPKAFRDFGAKFPKIAQAWDLLSEAGATGPLDEKTQRLIKLAVSIGTRAEGATHSATRKALKAGATKEEIYQVVALAASTLGLPNAVAAFTWIEDMF
ncbi:MAG: carboxymuconolactone decarboxylase family protein [Planctomycetes bacterium]|nr:carboxymuconolactone decarboxylase family protein [Planctomycetota bacterium]